MSAYTELSDEKLVHLFRTGDEKALNTLFTRYLPVAKAIASDFFSGAFDRDDLIQEGMLGFIDGLHSYDESRGASVRTYMNLCIKRKMITAIRKSTRKKDFPAETLTSLNDESVNKLINVNDNPEDFLIAKESAECLSNLIEDALSQFEINVLRLSIIGCSYSEISKQLNKSEKAVDNALQRARTKLHELVS